jgi:transglutaminase-like putative cysteine protease
LSSPSQTPLSDDPSDWLGETRHIDTSSRLVKETSASLTARLASPRNKALAIFAHVRDTIRFGFATGFWDNRASDVLAEGHGYCNTKSTALVALLRASGIPARQVFVDIDASVLHGILDPGSPYVDHSYAEIFLNDDWIKTDAYIVDPALFRAAQEKAVREQRLMAYGVHSTGNNEWDGLSPSFSQFNMLDRRPISTRNWGVYADVADFYRNADRTWNRLNPVLRASMGSLARGANRRAEALRN